MKGSRLTAVMFIGFLIVISAGIALQSESIFQAVRASYQQEMSHSPGHPLDAVQAAIAETEEAINNNFVYRKAFIEVNGLYQRVIDKKVVEDIEPANTVYKTADNQLVFVTKRQDVAQYVSSMAAFQRYLDTFGIPLLYVLPPSKIYNSEHQLPIGVQDYSEHNADAFLAGLKDRHIDYIDLRKVIRGSGMAMQDAFYNTDHHWTIDTAFYSFGVIVKTLNERYGFQIDPKYSDIRQYNRATYERFFLGSQGRRVGQLYGGVDDFTLITPRFDTEQELIQRDSNATKRFEGGFEEAVLVKDYVDPNKPASTNRYAVYHGDHAELVFHNKRVNSGKIVLIKDSYALPIYSFLSLCANEVRALDLRLYKQGTVYDYIKEYKPDMVMVLYSGFKEGMFDFDRISSAEM
ncbi:alginate O-acetyltransferase AlgX-related protein [Paenibacillus marinisediminis]